MLRRSSIREHQQHQHQLPAEGRELQGRTEAAAATATTSSSSSSSSGGAAAPAASAPADLRARCNHQKSHTWLASHWFPTPVLGSGGRSRYRTSNSSNNPNLMYQEECERRLRGVKDGRRDTSSFRDRDRGDGFANGASKAYGGAYGSPNSAFGAQQNQYGYAQGAYGAAAYGASGYGAEYGTAGYGGASTAAAGRASQSASQQQYAGMGRSGQQPQPLMSQQFPQPPGTSVMGYMGQTAGYQYPPPPPPPPPSRK